MTENSEIFLKEHLHTLKARGKEVVYAVIGAGNGGQNEAASAKQVI